MVSDACHCHLGQSSELSAGTSDLWKSAEIGVWKGKSAALAALHCEGDDACVFVDAMPLDEAKARITPVRPRVTCHYLQEQSQFLARHPFVSQGIRAFRWIHVDGEHSGQAVTNDLEIVDHLLSDRGIAVFDDFFRRLSQDGPRQSCNLRISVPVACPHSLRIQQGYLCRPEATREYLNLLRTSLYSNMAERGCDKSDNLEDYGARG